jgi:hypothetical protein
LILLLLFPLSLIVLLGVCPSSLITEEVDMTPMIRYGRRARRLLGLVELIISGFVPLVRQPHLEVGVIFANPFSLSSPATCPRDRTGRCVVCFQLLCLQGFIVSQRRRFLTAQNRQPSCRIDLLHALLLGFLFGSRGSLIAAYAFDIGGIVDVPRLLS